MAGYPQKAVDFIVNADDMAGLVCESLQCAHSELYKDDPLAAALLRQLLADAVALSHRIHEVFSCVEDQA
jgi:hypothetical protein